MSYNNQERKRNFNFSLIHAFIPIISAEHFEKSPCMAWCSYPDFLLSLFGFWRAYCILKLQSTKVSRTTTFINWLNSCCILCNFLKLSHFNWILIFLKDLNSCCLSKRPNRFSNRKGGKKKKNLKKIKCPRESQIKYCLFLVTSLVWILFLEMTVKRMQWQWQLWTAWHPSMLPSQSFLFWGLKQWQATGTAWTGEKLAFPVLYCGFNASIDNVLLEKHAFREFLFTKKEKHLHGEV